MSTISGNAVRGDRQKTKSTSYNPNALLKGKNSDSQSKSGARHGLESLVSKTTKVRRIIPPDVASGKRSASFNPDVALVPSGNTVWTNKKDSDGTSGLNSLVGQREAGQTGPASRLVPTALAREPASGQTYSGSGAPTATGATASTTAAVPPQRGWNAVITGSAMVAASGEFRREEFPSLDFAGAPKSASGAGAATTSTTAAAARTAPTSAGRTESAGRYGSQAGGGGDSSQGLSFRPQTQGSWRDGSSRAEMTAISAGDDAAHVSVSPSTLAPSGAKFNGNPLLARSPSTGSAVPLYAGGVFMPPYGASGQMPPGHFMYNGKTRPGVAPPFYAPPIPGGYATSSMMPGSSYQNASPSFRVPGPPAHVYYDSMYHPAGVPLSGAPGQMTSQSHMYSSSADDTRPNIRGPSGRSNGPPGSAHDYSQRGYDEDQSSSSSIRRDYDRPSSACDKQRDMDSAAPVSSITYKEAWSDSKMDEEAHAGSHDQDYWSCEPDSKGRYPARYDRAYTDPHPRRNLDQDPNAYYSRRPAQYEQDYYDQPDYAYKEIAEAVQRTQRKRQQYDRDAPNASEPGHGNLPSESGAYGPPHYDRLQTHSYRSDAQGRYQKRPPGEYNQGDYDKIRYPAYDIRDERSYTEHRGGNSGHYGYQQRPANSGVTAGNRERDRLDSDQYGAGRPAGAAAQRPADSYSATAATRPSTTAKVTDWAAASDSDEDQDDRPHPLLEDYPPSNSPLPDTYLPPFAHDSVAQRRRHMPPPIFAQDQMHVAGGRDRFDDQASEHDEAPDADRVDAIPAALARSASPPFSSSKVAPLVSRAVYGDPSREVPPSDADQSAARGASVEPLVPNVWVQRMEQQAVRANSAEPHPNETAVEGARVPRLYEEGSDRRNYEAQSTHDVSRGSRDKTDRSVRGGRRAGAHSGPSHTSRYAGAGGNGALAYSSGDYRDRQSYSKSSAAPTGRTQRGGRLSREEGADSTQGYGREDRRYGGKHQSWYEEGVPSHDRASDTYAQQYGDEYYYPSSGRSKRGTSDNARNTSRRGSRLTTSAGSGNKRGGARRDGKAKTGGHDDAPIIQSLLALTPNGPKDDEKLSVPIENGAKDKVPCEVNGETQKPKPGVSGRLAATDSEAQGAVRTVESVSSDDRTSVTTVTAITVEKSSSSRSSESPAQLAPAPNEDKNTKAPESAPKQRPEVRPLLDEKDLEELRHRDLRNRYSGNDYSGTWTGRRGRNGVQTRNDGWGASRRGQGRYSGYDESYGGSTSYKSSSGYYDYSYRGYGSRSERTELSYQGAEYSGGRGSRARSHRVATEKYNGATGEAEGGARGSRGKAGPRSARRAGERRSGPTPSQSAADGLAVPGSVAPLSSVKRSPGPTSNSEIDVDDDFHTASDGGNTPEAQSEGEENDENAEGATGGSRQRRSLGSRKTGLRGGLRRGHGTSAGVKGLGSSWRQRRGGRSGGAGSTSGHGGGPSGNGGAAGSSASVAVYHVEAVHFKDADAVSRSLAEAQRKGSTPTLYPTKGFEQKVTSHSNKATSRDRPRSVETARAPAPRKINPLEAFDLNNISHVVITDNLPEAAFNQLPDEFDETGQMLGEFMEVKSKRKTKLQKAAASMKVTKAKNLLSGGEKASLTNGSGRGVSHLSPKSGTLPPRMARMRERDSAAVPSGPTAAAARPIAHVAAPPTSSNESRPHAASAQPNLDSAPSHPRWDTELNYWGEQHLANIGTWEDVVADAGRPRNSFSTRSKISSGHANESNEHLLDGKIDNWDNSMARDIPQPIRDAGRQPTSVAVEQVAMRLTQESSGVGERWPSGRSSLAVGVKVNGSEKSEQRDSGFEATDGGQSNVSSQRSSPDDAAAAAFKLQRIHEEYDATPSLLSAATRVAPSQPPLSGPISFDMDVPALVSSEHASGGTVSDSLLRAGAAMLGSFGSGIQFGDFYHSDSGHLNLLAFNPTDGLQQHEQAPNTIGDDAETGLDDINQYLQWQRGGGDSLVASASNDGVEIEQAVTPTSGALAHAAAGSAFPIRSAGPSPMRMAVQQQALQSATGNLPAVLERDSVCDSPVRVAMMMGSSSPAALAMANRVRHLSTSSAGHAPASVTSNLVLDGTVEVSAGSELFAASASTTSAGSSAAAATSATSVASLFTVTNSDVHHGQTHFAEMIGAASPATDTLLPHSSAAFITNNYSTISNDAILLRSHQLTHAAQSDFPTAPWSTATHSGEMSTVPMGLSSSRHSPEDSMGMGATLYQAPRTGMHLQAAASGLAHQCLNVASPAQYHYLSLGSAPPLPAQPPTKPYDVNAAQVQSTLFNNAYANMNMNKAPGSGLMGVQQPLLLSGGSDQLAMFGFGSLIAPPRGAYAGAAPSAAHVPQPAAPAPGSVLVGAAPHLQSGLMASASPASALYPQPTQLTNHPHQGLPLPPTHPYASQSTATTALGMQVAPAANTPAASNFLGYSTTGPQSQIGWLGQQTHLGATANATRLPLGPTGAAYASGLRSVPSTIGLTTTHQSQLPQQPPALSPYKLFGMPSAPAGSSQPFAAFQLTAQQTAQPSNATGKIVTPYALVDGIPQPHAFNPSTMQSLLASIPPGPQSMSLNQFMYAGAMQGGGMFGRVGQSGQSGSNTPDHEVGGARSVPKERQDQSVGRAAASSVSGAAKSALGGANWSLPPVTDLGSLYSSGPFSRTGLVTSNSLPTSASTMPLRPPTAPFSSQQRNHAQASSTADNQAFKNALIRGPLPGSSRSRAIPTQSVSTRANRSNNAAVHERLSEAVDVNSEFNVPQLMEQRDVAQRKRTAIAQSGLNNDLPRFSSASTVGSSFGFNPAASRADRGFSASDKELVSTDASEPAGSSPQSAGNGSKLKEPPMSFEDFNRLVLNRGNNSEMFWRSGAQHGFGQSSAIGTNSLGSGHTRSAGTTGPPSGALANDASVRQKRNGNNWDRKDGNKKKTGFDDMAATDNDYEGSQSQGRGVWSPEPNASSGWGISWLDGGGAAPLGVGFDAAVPAGGRPHGAVPTAPPQRRPVGAPGPLMGFSGSNAPQRAPFSARAANFSARREFNSAAPGSSNRRERKSSSGLPDVPPMPDYILNPDMFYGTALSSSGARDASNGTAGKNSTATSKAKLGSKDDASGRFGNSCPNARLSPNSRLAFAGSDEQLSNVAWGGSTDWQAPHSQGYSARSKASDEASPDSLAPLTIPVTESTSSVVDASPSSDNASLSNASLSNDTASRPECPEENAVGEDSTTLPSASGGEAANCDACSVEDVASVVQS